MYNNPYVVEAIPDSVNVGKMAQVYIVADEDSTFFERKYYLIFLIISLIYSNSITWTKEHRSVRYPMSVWKIWNWKRCIH